MDVMEPIDPGPSESRRRTRGINLQAALPTLLLAAILSLAAVFRFTGVNWDESTHLHPDERFLTMVETSLELPQSLGEYFNTEESRMNPHNVGFGFFVYGTFPIFVVRYVAEWVAQTGYDEVNLVGRMISASLDLVTIMFIYLIGARLYRRRVGLLAAFLAASTALLIQHAHFFVVEPMLTMFVTIGMYAAVCIFDGGRFRDYAFFGVVLGMAVATKISIAPLAALAAAAAVGRMLSESDRKREFRSALLGLVAAAALSVLVFRFLQPYAFVGPSFWNVLPNQAWLNNIAEIARQNQGNTDAPYALQWADRMPVGFAWKNMVLWGMGIPLGIAAWIGWAWAVAGILRGRWKRHFLLVIWVGGYFLWQSTGFTPAMRYQLPVYPALIILAAWAVCAFWDWANQRQQLFLRITAASIAVIVSVGTLLWGVAFSGIYTRPVTRVEASRWIYENVPAVVNLVVEHGDERLLENVPMPEETTLQPGAPRIASFTSRVSGNAVELLFAHAKETEQMGGGGSLTAVLLDDPNSNEPLATALHVGAEHPLDGAELRIALDRPVHLEEGITYWVRLDWTSTGTLDLRGSILTSETTWDDGLPLRVDGRDIGGRYIGQNLELYWPDEQDDDQSGLSDKLERMRDHLAGGDYLIITSNRQFGTIPRLPQRYPLTTEYYRELMGCPSTLSVLTCYSYAEPGEYEGQLGYELIEVFDSSPRLGSLIISDQLAEEAFTVYDHPRVLIFQRTDSFSEEGLMAALADVDPFSAVHVLPRDADVGSGSMDLRLDDAAIEAQRNAGTWSDLFNRESLLNRSPLLAVVVWWFTLVLLSIVVYPLLTLIMPGMDMRAYPYARVAALLLLAWINWMLGSVGVPVTRLTVALSVIGLGMAGTAVVLRDHERWMERARKHWKSLLWVELASLGLFLLFLLVRYANPDLWHPAKGGEKPMDFSYFNAILKSERFPPYDPWFAGGYINYYYYGFVIVGMPVKLLGILPSIAYNLILPTIFSSLALTAFGVGYNLTLGKGKGERKQDHRRAIIAGILAALLLVGLGNLGTLRMFNEGFQQIGASANPSTSGFIQNQLNGLRGFFKYVTLQRDLPYGLEQWYWNPSRVIPPGEGEAGPITEFPYFTLLYGDLHAHLISRLITMLALGWCLSWVLAAREGEPLSLWKRTAGLVFGGVILGALPPTNTWDYPLYWLLGVMAVTYAAYLRGRRNPMNSWLWGALSVAVLLAASRLLYLPYHQAYGQGYMNVDLWEGSLTAAKDYLYMFGLPLFLLTSWLASETWRWMDRTPASALRSRGMVMVLGLFLVGIASTGLLMGLGFGIAPIVIPLAVWDGLLLLRQDNQVEDNIVHILIGGALALTFLVEVVVLRGDISRMNTVFKFYLQAWELMAVVGAVCMASLLERRSSWSSLVRGLWAASVIFLFFSAALYPFMATPAKIEDRMAREAPPSLDGMSFMPYATYYDMGQAQSLEPDYEAIVWMQDNLEGTPVILEANIPEYRWGSRYTIYTGLPGVLGWNWHQRQQRVAAGNPGVSERAIAITDFYMTTSVDTALAFLEEHHVEYVVVGMLEHLYFDSVQPCWAAGAGERVSCDLSGWPMGMFSPAVAPDQCEPLDSEDDYSQLRCPTFGLDKFPLMEELGYLETVYSNSDTVIFQVVP